MDFCESKRLLHTIHSMLRKYTRTFRWIFKVLWRNLDVDFCRFHIGAERSERSVDQQVADVVEQFLRTISGRHELEQFWILVDEVCV